jgi:Na+-translocating ferredoxin:NAD+ oxidoreductase subunit D
MGIEMNPASAERSLPDAPHIHAPRSQRMMAYAVVISLLPAAAWGLLSYGSRAAIVIAVAVASALACEAAASWMAKRRTILDGTAILTGFIVGLSLPPGSPLAAPALASAFAILIVKWPAGGLGANWMNPAMGGLAFAYASFRGPLSSYGLPSTVSGADALSAATPLMAAAHGGGAGAYAGTGFDAYVTRFMNDLVFRRLGAPISGGYVDLLFGNRPGSIGEASIVLLALGAVALFASGMIRWEIPAAGVIALSVLTWIFGGLSSKGSLFSGDAILAVTGGSAFICLFFCATDPVTSPKSRSGRLLYGAFIGSLSFVLRLVTPGGDPMAFVIIVGNAFATMIERVPGKLAMQEAK